MAKNKGIYAYITLLFFLLGFVFITGGKKDLKLKFVIVGYLLIFITIGLNAWSSIKYVLENTGNG